MKITVGCQPVDQLLGAFKIQDANPLGDMKQNVFGMGQDFC
jgi:hypothetical protein